MNAITDKAPALSAPNGHLLMGLISHRPQVDFRVFQAIEAAARSLIELGWWSNLLPVIGSADLAGARNNVVAECLAGPFTDLLFVDADVSWEQGAIEQLLSHPVDLVLATYPRRVEGPKNFNVRALGGKMAFVDPVSGAPTKKGLLEVVSGPTGCMRITRKCLQRMVEAYADRVYDEPVVSTGKAWNLFEFAIHQGKRWGEDMNFCRLWRSIGGQVWVDAHLTLHHHGDTSFSGCFADHLRSLGRIDG